MKKFVQYGAGNIGRGFLGQLFSLAGYEVTFIDVDMDVINELNGCKRYPVTVVSDDESEDIWIENVRGIDGRDINAVAQAVSEADIMATAVGVNVLGKIVPFIAEGIKLRYKKKDNRPFNIIICENMIGADRFLKEKISENLSEGEKEYFLKNTGLVEASIGKMVPVMTDEHRKGNPLRVCVEKYNELPVDKEAFKGDIPDVPHLFPFSPFEYYIKRKLFVHNMGHALAAYLGYIGGYEYIWQAMSDPCIKIIVQRAMVESAISLVTEFKTEPKPIFDHIYHLLSRFSNIALGDTVARVGNDIKRKLGENDRFVGALKSCEEKGHESVYIPIGIAAALFFESETDPVSKETKRKIEKNGFSKTLEEFTGIGEDDPSFNIINEYYNLLCEGGNIEFVLSKAEKLHKDILETMKII